MQWDRAKNFMIIFFVLTNVMLAALIRYETGSHTLTRERENAIQAVFAQNNITMYYSIPRNFAPMRPLRVAGHDYDIDRLLTIFFPPEAEGEMTHVTGINRDVFTWENIRLVIANGAIFFVSGLSNEGIPNKDAAKALAQAFIEEHYPGFELDIHSTREARRGGLRIFYRQVYQGHFIHTNFVEFLITGDGDDLIIEEVDILYGRPIGFAYLPRELIGPDEALLTFVQNIRRHNDMPIIINHMDIVYFQTTSGLREAYTMIYADPFYRIFIEGQEEPFRICAYTNRMQQ